MEEQKEGRTEGGGTDRGGGRKDRGLDRWKEGQRCRQRAAGMDGQTDSRKKIRRTEGEREGSVGVTCIVVPS